MKWLAPLWNAARCGCAFALVVLGSVWADLALSPQVYQPQTPAEAWNVIRLAMANANRLLAEHRLEEITDQISLCSPALRTLAAFGSGTEHRAVVDAETVIAYRGINDAAQSSLAGHREAAEHALSRIEDSLAKLQIAFAPEDVRAEIFTCPRHPEVIRPIPRSTCPQCSGPLRVRRIPYTEICPVPEAPIAKLQVSPLDAPIVPGREVRFQASLSDAAGGGFPQSRLVALHGEELLFFVADAALQDVRVLRSASGPPGPFELSFVPRLPGPHRLWAGLAPEETALVEYPWTDLGPVTPPVPEVVPAVQEVLSAEVGGYNVAVGLPGRGASLPARELSLLRMQVSDSKGQPCTSLEPVERAFAQITGIFDDGKTMIRLHPLGPEILREDLRGGPWLAFKIYPIRPGVLRLFCQVKIEGEVLTAPLGIRVTE